MTPPLAPEKGLPKTASAGFISPDGEVPFWRTEIGKEELSAVTATFRQKSFSQGPVTHELETEIAKRLGVPFAVCTTSGSMALTLALMAHDIGPGDEVIVPTRTFIATAHAALILGAKVVLVDCLADNPGLDIREVGKKITSRTRAIMPVHLNGRSVDMGSLLKLARDHGLRVIEDAAQGLFSKTPSGACQGTLGDAGCFSFSMVKLVSTGQGGAIVLRDEKTYQKLLALRNHGVRDVISHEYQSFGSNFKFNDVLASIGLCQVRKGNDKVDHVNAIYRKYREALEDLSFIDLVPVDIDNGEVALWPEVVCEDRDRLIDFLHERGIQTRKFLPCVHTAPHFADGRQFPNSERFSRIGLNLPGGPTLPLEGVDKTIEAVRNFR